MTATIARGSRRLLFVLLFASYAYFYQAGGWNQNSRFDLIRAITNEHTHNIDPFKLSTGDKAFFEGARQAHPPVQLEQLLAGEAAGDRRRRRSLRNCHAVSVASSAGVEARKLRPDSDFGQAEGVVPAATPLALFRQ